MGNQNDFLHFLKSGQFSDYRDTHDCYRILYNPLDVDKHLKLWAP